MAEGARSVAGIAVQLVRGVRRMLAGHGFASVPEFRLPSGRRADVLALGPGGEVVIVEVKSALPDFQADGKWPEYREWCDRFFFAVSPEFPEGVIPEDCGLLVADGFGAATRRDAPAHPLHPSRRRSLHLAVALAAAGRLHRLDDPAFDGWSSVD